MNKIVKRGLSAYVIFIKNRIVTSIMMLSSGIMMFIAALDGKGNDVKTLPIIITSLGAILSLYAFYRLGYIKSQSNNLSSDEREEKIIMRKVFFSQIIETVVYLAVAGLGIFLLTNEGFTNVVLNIMSGFFTTLNGIFGTIYIIKNRQNKDFQWKFRLVLTVLEYALGIYFLVARNSIDISGYIVMGALTSVAGVIEVISAFTKDTIKSTISDGKDIVHIMKSGEKIDKNAIQ